ncbi:MAG: hypothetical protein JW795_03635, partial [Chitinivibrionales bacterium]|nr:hypothetical protein [Chitinivibrionales bacterium]
GHLENTTDFPNKNLRIQYLMISTEVGGQLFYGSRMHSSGSATFIPIAADGTFKFLASGYGVSRGTLISLDDSFENSIGMANGTFSQQTIKLGRESCTFGLYYKTITIDFGEGYTKLLDEFYKERQYAMERGCEDDLIRVRSFITGVDISGWEVTFLEAETAAKYSSLRQKSQITEKYFCFGPKINTDLSVYIRGTNPAWGHSPDEAFTLFEKKMNITFSQLNQPITISIEKEIDLKEFRNRYITLARFENFEYACKYFMARQSDDPEKCEELLKDKYVVDYINSAKNKEIWYCFQHFIDQSDMRYFKMFIDAGLDFNGLYNIYGKENNPESPLGYLSRNSIHTMNDTQRMMRDYLIKKGAKDIRMDNDLIYSYYRSYEGVDFAKSPPLFRPAVDADFDEVKRLVEKGEDINALDEHGYSALAAAMSRVKVSDIKDVKG